MVEFYLSAQQRLTQRETHGLTRKTASARLSTANGAQALGNTLRTQQRAFLDSAKTAGMPELE